MSKTVVITGATSGFGKACVDRFAEDGWNLVLVGRREERLKQIRKELGDRLNVHTVALDVRDKKAVFSAFRDLPEEFAEVDVLVNNAGLALGLEPSWETNLDDWETMVDTNIKGVLYCTRALLPRMVKRNSGQVVNIGSVFPQSQVRPARSQDSSNQH